MPALARARKTSQVAVCTSNLKQINTAAFMYQDDSDGYYPAGNYANGLSWDDMLGEYDGRGLTETEQLTGGKWGPTKSALPNGNLRGDLYRCPLDNRELTDDYILRTYSHSQSYYHEELGLTWVKGGGIIGLAGDDGNPPQSKKLTDINDPSNSIAFTELADKILDPANDNNHLRSRMGTSWGWTGVRADQQENAGESHHHNNKYNYAMVDGHVEQMTIIQTLITSDGAINSSSNVIGTKWDATK